MAYLRQRPRIPATGRVTVRLTPAQRDLFIGSAATPKNLSHALHRAAVREGKLAVRLDRELLDTLILAAAKLPAADRKSERSIETLLRYLESLADRFAEPEKPEEHENSDTAADSSP